MPRTSNARQQMIQSAAYLFRESGVEGTAFADVLEHSGAPRGSVYHHFPGGKAELVEAATEFAGEYIASSLASATAKQDPAAAIDAIIAGVIESARSSEFKSGCPVVAAAVEGERQPEARDAAGSAFASWEKLIAKMFRGSGVPPRRSRSLATLVVSAIEGALVLARAQRSTKPLERVGVELKLVVSAAI